MHEKKKEEKMGIKKKTVMQGMAMEEETEEHGCKYGNGVATIFFWGGHPADVTRYIFRDLLKPTRFSVGGGGSSSIFSGSST